MDLLSECAKNYYSLLNTKYCFVVGKKGRLLSYSIIFRPVDFHHLIGLQYLTDILSIKRENREATFNNILNGSISTSTISQSKFYGDIVDRINLVANLAQHIESDNLFFKFYVNRITGSHIDADFLIVDNDAHIFLSRVGSFADVCNLLYCKSAFINETDRFTQKQESWVILKKTKTNTNNEEKTLYINPVYRESE